MAIPWLAVLKVVPWGDVISNAPKVADGAKKLWSNIGNKAPKAEAEIENESPAVAPDGQSIAALRRQLAAVKADAAELHEQMFASSELIKALAEQNAQLIRRIEVQRVRGLWLAAAIAVTGLVAIAGLGLTLAG
ncbi:MAG: hypothetical protein KJ787_14505 [Gammaproteobacteria bacterium]|nr:hypothetical protein [Gammaproteobacteria bacterium]MBU1647541.1 hypothetical protein [Gammaproteobacteria bacterium]MBU1972990.1 hypothetical protein [Gammaproteobacteria bacterium]